jgi:hypothetical protein
MNVTAWSNGTENLNGNGISLSPTERDLYLKREWKSIIIELGDTGNIITVNIDKDSLWTGSCPHLISVEIGQWLHENNLSPWVKDNPPKLYLNPKKGNRFKLSRYKGITDNRRASELLSKLYLRLNGYLLTGLIVHARQGNAAEIDIIAVRFPNSNDTEREIGHSEWLQIPTDKIDIIIGEVKSGNPTIKFNVPLIQNRHDAIRKILRWIGLFTDDEITSLTPQLHRNIQDYLNPITDEFPTLPSFPNSVIRCIFFAPEQGEPNHAQRRYVYGQVMLDYIWNCLCPDFKRIDCDHHYDYNLWNEYEPIVRYLKERNENNLPVGTIQELFDYLRTL